MVYFLRHGESNANVAGLFAGQKEDSHLTTKGRVQAEQAAHSLKNIPFFSIVSSRLKRAQQTAEIIAQEIGFEPEKILLDKRIIEYDMGSLTGKPLRKVSSHQLISAPGAENVNDFQKRIVSFLKTVKNSNGNHLIVSHAGVGRMIECTKQNLNPESFYGLTAYPNASPIELDLSWL